MAILGCLVCAGLLLLTNVRFIELHGPDGQTYYVAEGEISTLRMPVKSDLKGFTAGTRCVVVTTNGKFLAVTETCRDIRDTLGRPAP